MTADHIPDLVLERYRLNELPPADAARIAGEISRDARLRERLAALDRSDHELGAHLDRVRTRLAASSVRGVRLLERRSLGEGEQPCV
jgi:anti-sigma factor RsiW